MTTLDDWTDARGNDGHQISIELRQHQFRELFDQKLPVVRNRVQEKHLKQQEAQNRRFNSQRPLPKLATSVTPALTPWKTSLTHDSTSPYKITEATRLGNYKLTNATGKPVPGSFPIEKLKPFVDNEESQQNAEIADILADRVQNGKWKDDDSEEWIAEEDFNAVELVNSYWLRKNTVVEASTTLPRPRGRSP